MKSSLKFDIKQTVNLTHLEGNDHFILNLRKNWLVNKCKKEFATHADGLAGCLFLANYMEAAGNPQHDYVEVECPDFMKAKY